MIGTTGKTRAPPIVFSRVAAFGKGVQLLLQEYSIPGPSFHMSRAIAARSFALVKGVVLTKRKWLRTIGVIGRMTAAEAVEKLGPAFDAEPGRHRFNMCGEPGSMRHRLPATKCAIA